MAFRLENAGSRGRGAAWEPAKLRPVYWGLEGGAGRSCKGGIIAVAILSVSECISIAEPFGRPVASKGSGPEEFATILNI